MADQNTSTRGIALRDIPRAIVLLTRLPVPGADGQRAAASAWAWPIAGLAVGGIGAAVAWAGLGLSLSPLLAAGLGLAAMALATGALHEDGFADCADGFWGGHSPERRLEIMKDSRIGAYGVLALIFAVGLKWIALAEVIEAGAWGPAILVAASLSRAAMAATMRRVPFARTDGLARHVGRPTGRTAALALGLGLGIALLALGPVLGLLSVLAAGGATGLVAWVAKSKIGGQTGDVLGATQISAELAVLITLAAALGAT